MTNDDQQHLYRSLIGMGVTHDFAASLVGKGPKPSLLQEVMDAAGVKTGSSGSGLPESFAIYDEMPYGKNTSLVDMFLNTGIKKMYTVVHGYQWSYAGAFIDNSVVGDIDSPYNNPNSKTLSYFGEVSYNESVSNVVDANNTDRPFHPAWGAKPDVERGEVSWMGPVDPATGVMGYATGGVQIVLTKGEVSLPQRVITNLIDLPDEQMYLAAQISYIQDENNAPRWSADPTQLSYVTLVPTILFPIANTEVVFGVTQASIGEGNYFYLGDTLPVRTWFDQDGKTVIGYNISPDAMKARAAETIKSYAAFGAVIGTPKLAFMLSASASAFDVNPNLWVKAGWFKGAPQDSPSFEEWDPSGVKRTTGWVDLTPSGTDLIFLRRTGNVVEMQIDPTNQFDDDQATLDKIGSFSIPQGYQPSGVGPGGNSRIPITGTRVDGTVGSTVIMAYGTFSATVHPNPVTSATGLMSRTMWLTDQAFPGDIG